MHLSRGGGDVEELLETDSSSCNMLIRAAITEITTGPTKIPDESEYLQAAQQGEQQQQGMEFYSSANDQRPNDVVDRADHRGAPDDQDDSFPEMTGRHEVDRRGQPDQHGSYDRDQGTERGGQPQQQR